MSFPRTGAVVAALFLLTSCSSTPQGGATDPSVSPSSAVSAEPVDQGQPQAPAETELPAANRPEEADLHGHDHEPLPVPVWDAQSRYLAVKVGREATSAFIGGADDAEAWYGALEPFLTIPARAAYSTVNPDAIASGSVISGDLVDDSSAYLAEVDVVTTAGTYVVMLQRDGADSPWLVERITQERS